jgi:hypothetical protein
LLKKRLIDSPKSDIDIVRDEKPPGPAGFQLAEGVTLQEEFTRGEAAPNHPLRIFVSRSG